MLKSKEIGDIYNLNHKTLIRVLINPYQEDCIRFGCLLRSKR